MHITKKMLQTDHSYGTLATLGLQQNALTLRFPPLPVLPTLFPSIDSLDDDGDGVPIDPS